MGDPSAGAPHAPRADAPPTPRAMGPEGAAGPPPKRPRFSIDPDVEVAVGGEVVKVHSYVLMSKSPVFRQMLTSGMCEATNGRINLTGKTKAEFDEFFRHLDGGARPEIQPDVAQWLVAWADEYDVPWLKKQCEEALVEEISDFGSARQWENLELATRFNLERLRQDSVLAISNDIFSHRHRLREILEQPMFAESDDEGEEASESAAEGVHGCVDGADATDAPAAQEKGAEAGETDPHRLFKYLILPRLHAAVFLGKPKFDEIPGAVSVDALWPIVVRALELADGWTDLQEANRAARRAAAVETEVLKAIPVDEPTFHHKRVAFRDIHRHCKDAVASNESQLRDVIQALCRRGSVKRRGQHYYKTPGSHARLVHLREQDPEPVVA